MRDIRYEALLKEVGVYQRSLKDLNRAFMQREIEIRELKQELKNQKRENQ